MLSIPERVGTTEASAQIMKRVHKKLALFPTLPDDALIEIRVVSALLGRSASSIWRDVAKRELVAPIKIGHSTRWRVGEIREYLSRREVA